MSTVLSKSSRKPIDKEYIKYFNGYFSRPQSISLIQIGDKKVLYITEDIGMYTFCGPSIMLNKIGSSLQTYANKNGNKANLDYINYKDDEEFLEKINALLG